MMRQTTARRLLLVAIPALGLVLSTGCFTIAPTPEAALEGTWKLTTAQSTDLTQTFVTFDALGRLTRVTYKIGTNTTITNENVTATSNVEGDNVSVVATFGGGNTVVFNGTFNADKTVIEGTQGTEIKIGGVTISIDNGAVTATKQ